MPVINSNRSGAATAVELLRHILRLSRNIGFTAKLEQMTNPYFVLALETLLELLVTALNADDQPFETDHTPGGPEDVAALIAARADAPGRLTAIINAKAIAKGWTIG